MGEGRGEEGTGRRQGVSVEETGPQGVLLSPQETQTCLSPTVGATDAGATIASLHLIP